MKMTDGEKKQLFDTISMVNELKNYLNSSSINQTDDIGQIFKYLNGIKDIQGNFNHSISYVSCLLAKEYLQENYGINNMDVSIKPQGANGLDFDEKLNNGKRIIGEIKTIKPYGENDFGAQQKREFREDFRKLNETSADYKILFVTEPKSFQILNEKYLKELNNVKIVLLVK
ncbi:hypothetical protein AGMMS49546_33330 [Spirochaetia bacterium]|nr:hypothetical protein AGMMS49546_33330 [Spirochaetia bacterium]